MDSPLALSALGLALAGFGLILGAVEVHQRVQQLRAFARPAETPPLAPFRETAEEVVRGVRGSGLFGDPALSTDRSLRMMNQLRETQERQAGELRELADRIAGIAGVTDRPWRLWLSFALVAGGTLLSGAGDIAAALGNCGL